MPIAHCLVDKNCVLPQVDIISLWAEESGVASEHLTLTFNEMNAQYGNHYSIMANLYLPSLWSAEKVDKIQLGLSQSLIRSFELSAEQVFVMTQVIKSGHVIENGNIQYW